jgi:hypothetical protein
LRSEPMLLRNAARESDDILDACANGLGTKEWV